MKNKYWFKPKHYGYGFYPVTWEGWLATLLLVVVLLISGYVNNIFVDNVTTQKSLRFLLDILVFASLATIFFDKKMKEELKWRWGRKR